jgi:type I restriction enzyme S subunit
LTESRKYSEVKKGFTPMTDEDVIFAKITPCMENGKIAIVDSLRNKIGFGSTEFHVFRNLSAVLNRYLFYYFIQLKIRYEASQNMTGAVGQRRVPKKFLEDLSIPLPPLPEQHRIVAKIEELFSSLDNGIQNLKTSQQQLKIYRQAVLKWAFDGKFLSEINNDKLPENWTMKKINSLCEVVRGGSPRPAGDVRYYEGNIPFLKVADLTKNDGVHLNTHTFTIKGAGLTKTRYVKSNTLLLSNSGATLGVPKICTFPTTFNDGIAAFLGLEEDTLLYHYYFWVSKTKELRAINQGAAQPNLNTGIIGEIEIPIGTPEDMKMTVKEIESRLSVCDKLEETIQTSLKQAEILRQSILKKAFSGQLVPQNPNDEHASLLLEKIQAERTKNPSKSPRHWYRLIGG